MTEAEESNRQERQAIRCNAFALGFEINRIESRGDAYACVARLPYGKWYVFTGDALAIKEAMQMVREEAGYAEVAA